MSSLGLTLQHMNMNCSWYSQNKTWINWSRKGLIICRCLFKVSKSFTCIWKSTVVWRVNCLVKADNRKVFILYHEKWTTKTNPSGFQLCNVVFSSCCLCLALVQGEGLFFLKLFLADDPGRSSLVRNTKQWHSYFNLALLQKSTIH